MSQNTTDTHSSADRRGDTGATVGAPRRPRPARHTSSEHIGATIPRASVPHALILVGLVAILAAVFVLSLVIGSTSIPLHKVIGVLFGGGAGKQPADIIVSVIRLPRSITAMLAGAALGIAGLQMQTLFRNPLADPFALGIMSGASLGVALVVLGTGAGIASMFSAGLGIQGDLVVTLAAIAGAGIVLGLVVIVSARIESATTVLILGLMFGYATSAFVTVLIAASDPIQLQQWASWGFGSFSGVTWNRLIIFAPLICFGIVIAASTTKQLNALLLGERYARSMGVAVRRTRLLTMCSASVLGAVVTAFCGPIAFIGIAIPHLCRGLFGTSDHRVLVPAVVFMGALVALFAQLVALLPGSYGVLPLNAVNALVGAPVVAFVLLHSRNAVTA